MAKFTGIRIRLGAAHDDVSTIEDGEVRTTFDRSEMRKAGAHKSQGALRRGVVEAWEDSDRKRRQERAERRDKQRKQARRNKHSSRHEAA